MELVETDDKHFCSECDEFTYVFEIGLGDEKLDPYSKFRLCKTCLLRLQKLIYER